MHPIILQSTESTFTALTTSTQLSPVELFDVFILGGVFLITGVLLVMWIIKLMQQSKQVSELQATTTSLLHQTQCYKK